MPSSPHISLPQPSKKISTEEDVELFKTTSGYKNFIAFLHLLNDSVVGHSLPSDSGSPSTFEGASIHPSAKKILLLLDTLKEWIEEIPPLETPQRFGNLAFRTWGKRLEERIPTLVASLYGEDTTHSSSMVEQLSPYLLTSFGSFTRMDYGTGHEVSFAMFLLSLSLSGFFSPSTHSSSSSPALSSTTPTLELQSAKELDPALCRQLVLLVFTAYFKLCYHLQDTYRLEPAGSHGVWGLDDSSFLPYLFGSGMLRDQIDEPPSVILKPGLPRTNLYYLAVERVREVKKGPFHEHSSQLHSIATGVPKWKKVNEGLFKMYGAEVLGKRVVVQHLPLGGLIAWDPSAPSQPPTTHLYASGTLPASTPPVTAQVHTRASAPQSQLSRGGAAYVPSALPAGTQAPWASRSTGASTGTGWLGPDAGSGTKAPWAK